MKVSERNLLDDTPISSPRAPQPAINNTERVERTKARIGETDRENRPLPTMDDLNRVPPLLLIVAFLLK